MGGSERLWVTLAAVFGLTGVAAGALGAHALEDVLASDRLDTFEAAVRYQVYHALALLGVAYLSGRWGGKLVTVTGWLFTAGVLLFSGSLYLLALLDLSWTGAVAPLGGASFLAGWTVLLVGAVRHPDR